jgi:pimeloyl-ACP methyl ester carboxylesterase
MYTFETLDIVGYRGEALPHAFLKQSRDAHHVAVLLPGMGYTAHMPLLYYPMLELLRRRADVLRLETMYVKHPEYDRLSTAEKVRWAFTDAAAACRAALAQRVYDQVTLVGKSLGTLAMGHLITSEAALAQAQAVWLTPLLGNDILRAQIQQARPRSLFVSGTADAHYNAARLAEVQAATGAETVVIEGANHSLELEGDVIASLRALERVVRAVQAFLDTG